MPDPLPPDPIVIFTGYYQFSAGERITQPQVQSRLLLWCKKGRGRIQVNGETYPVVEDDFYFLPWNRKLVYLPDAREPFLTGTVHLLPFHKRGRKVIFDAVHESTHDLFNKAWRQDRPLGAWEGVQRGSMKNAVQLHHLAEYIVQRFHGREPVEWEARALAQLLLAELFALSKATRGETRKLPVPLLQMVEFIEHRRELKIGLRDLQRVSGLSASAVGRMFQRYLDLSPVAFITRDKLNYAKFFLAKTDKPVGEIGRISGIGDPYYFSKLFRKHTEMSPLEYRRKSEFL